MDFYFLNKNAFFILGLNVFYIYGFMGRGGALVQMTFNRRVVGSTPALAAT